VNFAEVRKIKGQREGQWPAKASMFATFTEIGGLSYNQNQKPVCKCKLTDDMNETHLVTLYVKQAIPPNMLNQRQPFKLYAYDGNYQQKSYVGYAGLWQDRPQSAPTTPQNAPQSTNAPTGGIGQALALCNQLRAVIASMGQQAQQSAPPQDNLPPYQPDNEFPDEYCHQPDDDQNVPF
jgi:hypothetical protein